MSNFDTSVVSATRMSAGPPPITTTTRITPSFPSRLAAFVLILKLGNFVWVTIPAQVNSEVDPVKPRALVARFVDLAEPLDGAYITQAAALAKELRVHMLLGFLQRNESLVHNAAALFDDTGKLVLLYHKTHFAQVHTHTHTHLFTNIHTTTIGILLTYISVCTHAHPPRQK